VLRSEGGVDTVPSISRPPTLGTVPRTGIEETGKEVKKR